MLLNRSIRLGVIVLSSQLCRPTAGVHPSIIVITNRIVRAIINGSALENVFTYSI